MIGREELVLRPLAAAAAAWMADVLTACRPEEPVDPEVLRHYWIWSRPGWFASRNAVLVEGEPAGLAACTHAAWDQEPERFGHFEVSLVPRHRHLAPLVITRMEATLLGEGSAMLHTVCFEDETWLREGLEQAGYRLDRVERGWELDLRREGDRLLNLLEESRARLAGGGLEIITLEQAGSVEQEVTALFNETEEDIPHTGPVHAKPLEEVRHWLHSPAIRADRVWLALDAGRPVAMSFLLYPPSRGHVWTGYTCSARSHRGRGLARAVKLESLGQAANLGVPSVRTGNDAENAAILHINEQLGYHAISGAVEYLKEAVRPG